jgi:hypothetical protein
MPRTHGPGDSEVLVMVQVRRQSDATAGSATIGRRVGGEIETVGVAATFWHPPQWAGPAETGPTTASGSPAAPQGTGS